MHTNESKGKIKKYERLWSKIRVLIKSMTKNSMVNDDYDKKIWISNLTSNKTIEIPTMTIVVGAIFLENNKYYPRIFLDEYLYKLQII